jgi:hypothetical protein
MLTRCRAAAALAALTLSGCSTLKIKTEYDPQAQFASYKSYAWLATAPGVEQAAAIQNPGVRSLVVTAVDREMANRGFVRTTPDANPDFFVSVIGWGKNRVEVTNYGYAYAPGFYPYVHSGGVSVNEYSDGTLLLDFVDAKTKQLFWRGTANDTISSADQLKGAIDEAAKQLVAAFPPKVEKK